MRSRLGGGDGRERHRTQADGTGGSQSPFRQPQAPPVQSQYPIPLAGRTRVPAGHKRLHEDSE